MQAPVDDRADLVIDSLRHWKPVKVISDCRCNNNNNNNEKINIARP